MEMHLKWQEGRRTTHTNTGFPLASHVLVCTFLGLHVVH